MSLSDTAIVSRAAQLMEAELGDELVALDVEQGLCFGLNAPAASVWRLIEQPQSVAEIKTALLAEYDVGADELSGDLQVLLADMLGRGLVRIQ